MVLKDGSEPHSTITAPAWCQKHIEMFGRLEVLPKLPRDERRYGLRPGLPPFLFLRHQVRGSRLSFPTTD